MNNEINIEEIMNEIRQNIKERGYDKEPLSFEDVAMSEPAVSEDTHFSMTEFLTELNYMNRNCCNSLNVPVESRNSIGVFVKKMIRKCTRFIVFPIVNFQNAYNVSNVRCINQLKEYVVLMEGYTKRIEQLEKEVEELKKKVK